MDDETLYIERDFAVFGVVLIDGGNLTWRDFATQLAKLAFVVSGSPA
jgi:hypothetical protein